MTMPDTEEQHTHTQTGGQGVGLRAKGALSVAAKRLKTLLSTWHKNAVPNPQQELQESASLPDAVAPVMSPPRPLLPGQE